MAGFVSLGNDKYLGTVVCDEANGVKNGVFVKVDFATSKGTLANATSGDGDVFFVANEIDTIDEQGINDEDFVVKKDKYLRLHAPLSGEVLVTTEFNGSLVKGDKVAVGVGGKVEAVGTRTPKTAFIVKELTSAYGLPALSLQVL